MEWSLGEVRGVVLAAQGLVGPLRGEPKKKDVLATIRRMGSLQIDAINVVARSQYLVLWSRLGCYEARWLDELLAERKLFEHWAHAACFVPIEDFPLFRRRMLETGGWRAHPVRWAQGWLAANADVAAGMLAYIRENGPVRTSDFERTDGKAGGWWNWKVEKAALEALHSTGELMIARREGFQRVYDLRERVLPGWDDARAVSSEEMQREFVLRTVRELGVARARWVDESYYLMKKGIAAHLERLADEGALLRARCGAWRETLYLHPESVKAAQAAVAGKLKPQRTTFLSPFDPLVRDRARARDLYGFEYTIEVYTPAEKRRYGYFTMPILHGDTLVGRIDPKAERKEGRLLIRTAHLEPGVAVDEPLVEGMAEALRDFARFHEVAEIVIERSDPAELAPALRARLAV
ncbi:MAG: crosslink repair DNA glycosylase YcaQ family protein [Thermomicrobiales bacterium]